MKKTKALFIPFALTLLMFLNAVPVSAINISWYPPYAWQKKQTTYIGWVGVDAIVNKDTAEIKVYAWSNPFSAARAHGWIGAYFSPYYPTVVSGMKAKFEMKWKNDWGWPNQAWVKVEYQIYDSANGPIESGGDGQGNPIWDPSVNALRRVLVLSQWDTNIQGQTFEIDKSFSSSLSLTVGKQYMIAFLFYCGSWYWASSGGAVGAYNYAKVIYISLY